MKRLRNSLLLSLCLLLPSTSRGLEVFGNGVWTDNDNAAGFTFGVHNAWAVPFTPGASSSLEQRTLTGAWVLVGDSADPRPFSVSIYDDSGTNSTPTTLRATGSLTVSSGAVSWHEINFDTPFVLTASTNYYFAVEAATASSNFAWRPPTNIPTYPNLGSGSSYQITGDPGVSTIRNRFGSPWGSSPYTVPTAPLGLQRVPEPSTYVLSALSFGTIFASRRFRRKRS